MSLANVTAKSHGGLNLPSAWTFQTKAGNTAINAGEPVILVNTNYAGPLTDALPSTSTPLTNGLLGIATSTDTVTASADGVVDVIIPTPNIVWTCKAKDTATIDTAAEVAALVLETMAFDLTGGVYTVDTAVNTATFGLQMVGANITTGEVYFVVRPSATTFF